MDTLTFNLVDENGFIFEFSTKEVNTTFSTVPGESDPPPTDYLPCFQDVFAVTNRAGESLITNWSLDRVTSPRGRVLEFEYQKGLHFSFPSYSFDGKGDDHYTKLQGWLNEQYEQDLYKTNGNVSTTIIENNYLTSITGDFGEVKFNLDGRLDLSTGTTIELLSQGNFGANALHTSESTVRACHGEPDCPEITDSSPYLPLKLSSIEVKNPLQQTTLTAQFNLTYFNNDKIADPIKERYLRLKLDSMIINGRTYGFEYINPNGLPSKDSDGIDFWGYYNGKESNDGLVPRLGRFITSKIDIGPSGLQLAVGQSFVKYDGADRSSDFTYGQRGLLEKIVYPTGGSTEFTFEAHDVVLEVPRAFNVTEYFDIPGYNRYRWTDMIDESKFHITYQYLKNAKDPTYNYFEMEDVFDQGDAIIVEQEMNTVFSVEFPSLLEVNGYIDTFTGHEGISYWSEHPILVVEEIYTGQEYELFTYADAPSNPEDDPRDVTKTIAIPPGDYRVVTRTGTLPPGEDYGDYPPVPASMFFSDSILLHTFESEEPEDMSYYFEYFEIGGARIQKIKHKDSNGDMLNGTSYDYNYTNGFEGLTSSGLLMDDLIFHKKASGFQSYSPRGYTSFFLSGHNQVGGNNSAQGSHIGYSFVQEFQIDEQNNNLGRVEREYHNLRNKYFEDSFCLPYQYDIMTGPDIRFIIRGVNSIWTCLGEGVGPDCGADDYSYSSYGESCIENTVLLGLPLRLSFSHSNGNISEERIFDSDGNLVMKIENAYANLSGNLPTDYFSSFINIGIQVASIDGEGAVESDLLNTSEGPWGINNHSYFPYLFPQHHGLVSKLSGSIKTEYFATGELITESIYSYNDTTHLTTSSATELNESDMITNYLYYPYDDEVYFNNGMDDLRSENRLTTVIKATQFKNSDQLSTLEYNYDNNPDTGNKTLVTGVFKSKEDLPLERIIAYENYDSQGNLLQFRKEDGTATTYIWGYNGQYPIVKIENALVTDVPVADLTDLHVLSDSDDDRTVDVINPDGSITYQGNEGALRQALRDLRESMPGAMVTTYTYDPLIGVTSITDPRGNTTYYEYDEFNRLKEVKDADGHILSHNTYHYKD